MIISAFLIVVLIAVGITAFVIFAQSRRSERSRISLSVPSVPAPSVASSVPEQRLLDIELARWVAAGLLTSDQAASIRAHERPTNATRVVAVDEPIAPRQISRSVHLPSVAEALGYLGGALVFGGLALLVSRYWNDLTVASRLALVGSAAVLLVVAGAFVRTQGAAELNRLRALLWLAAVSTTAAFVVIAVRDGADVHTDATVVLAAAGAVAVESGLLWWGRDRPVQQLTFLLGFMVFIAAIVAEVAEPPGPPGLAIWATGAIEVVLGVRRWIRSPLMTEAVGAIALFVGGIMTANSWQGPGLLLLTATAVALLTVAVIPGLAPHHDDQLTVGIIGAVGVFITAPQTLAFFSQDAAIATGLATYAVGVGLLRVGDRHVVRVPRLVELAGAVLVLTGAAFTWNQWHGIAPVFGAVTAVALIAVGIVRDRLPLSLVGSVGLLLTVPWIIVWYFPGQGRVPLLTAVSGTLILIVAVALARMGRRRNHPAPERSQPAATNQR